MGFHCIFRTFLERDLPKYSENPSITRSMRIALADLKLDHLRVVIPGSVRTNLDERIEAVGIEVLE